MKHPFDLGSYFLYYAGVRLVETESNDGCTLIARTASQTLYECNFNLSHLVISSLLTVNFFYSFATEFSNFVDILQTAQAFDRSLNHVVRVGRTDRFGEDVADASQFQYGTNRAAGNNASTFSSRFQEYFASAENTCNRMGNGTVFQRNGNHMFLSVFNAFADCFRNFTGFA